MDHREKSPLLTRSLGAVNVDKAEPENKPETETKPEVISEHVPRKWGHYLMGPCLMLHLFSYLYFSIVNTQYIYSYFAKEKYPNSTITKNRNDDSDCINVNKSSLAYHERTTIQKMTSEWQMVSALASSGPAIVMDIIMGSLSDKYGRKVFVILTLLGTLLKTSLVALGIRLGINVSVFYLFVAIEGLTGGWCLCLSLGFAYVSDITTSGKQRTLAIALLEIAVGLGLVFSGVTSGYLIKDIGFFYSMVMISVVNFVNLVMIILFLPESIDKTKQHGRDILDLFKNGFTFYIRDTSEKGKRWKYILGMLSFVAFNFSIVGRQGIEPLYQLNAPFCWNSVKIGWYASISDVVRNVIGLGSIKLFQRCVLDEIIVIISGISSACAYTLEAFAYNDVMLTFGEYI